MSGTENQPPAPQPNTVADAPATVEAAAQDYAQRSGTTAMHPSSFPAAPHTHGRP
jgi:hypothetical protein